MPEQFGSYTVYDEIGVGGMAAVHIAESKTFGRVALKRLHEYAASEPDTVRAFLDEARLVVHLNHPNIAKTYEAGKVGDIYFIAMEYVPGHTLAQLIDRCAKTIGVMPFPITVNILMQVCDALEYAHTLKDAAGKPLKIIHRDVSPSNVILSSTGIAKLIDFGIAKATSSTVHSHAGVVKGKFQYMAPEYLKGKLDHRVDLWALGTVAYELLTNRHLFQGDDDFKVLYNVKYAEITPPSKFNEDVPNDFDVIVMTALQRDPDRRWQSAGAMRTALVNAANELQTTVTNAQLIEWVDWTFTQAPPKAGSELSQLIKLFERPSRMTRRPSSEYDVSFEMLETDPNARESKRSFEALSDAAARDAAEVLLTTTPYERKSVEITPRPFARKDSEPAVTTPFERRGREQLSDYANEVETKVQDAPAEVMAIARDGFPRKDSEPATTKPFERKGSEPAMTKPFERRQSEPAMIVDQPPRASSAATPPAIPSTSRRGTPNPDAAPSSKRATPNPDAAPSSKRATPNPDAAPSSKRATPNPDAVPSSKRATPNPDAASSVSTRGGDAAASSKRATPSPDAAPSAGKRATPNPDARTRDAAASTRATPDPDARARDAAASKRATPDPDDAAASLARGTDAPARSRTNDAAASHADATSRAAPSPNARGTPSPDVDKRPTPFPRDLTLEPAARSTSDTTADDGDDTAAIAKPSRRLTPLPARTASAPPIKPTPVSFDDLPKLDEDARRMRDADQARNDARDTNDRDAPSHEVETRAAVPAKLRRPSAPEPRRSSLRAWLLFFLLLATTYAVWHFGYAPREVTDYLGIPERGPIEF